MNRSKVTTFKHAMYNSTFMPASVWNRYLRIAKILRLSFIDEIRVNIDLYAYQDIK